MTGSAVDATPLVHEARYRVRFDEAGPDGLLRTSGLMRYAQDVAWQHSTALGFGREWYLERGLTWLVRSAELEVLAPIPMGVDVVSRTQVVGQRRVWARRRGEFVRADGALAAWVHTDWVMIDRRGALTRIPEIFGEAFRIPEASGQIGRVALPPTPDGTVGRSFAVRPHELDPMDHVNNAVYLDWLEEAVLGAAAATGEALRLDATPRRYRLEYAAAADAGMILADAAWRESDGSWRYKITANDGPEVFRAAIDRIGGHT
ncbi:MAG TPA: acyl-ACP thioesterase domain-containing protein [Candidatus Limnocylindrales bacterium]|nr:acyl-ACP thioesterase domain-containing protein [Candidatus Limnocylindrales bacterium]